MILITASWTMLWPPCIVLQTLRLRYLIPWIYLSLPLYKGFDLGLTWMIKFFVYFCLFVCLFSYFLLCKPLFCSKELMIWATGSYRSCFCWLHRHSTSLTAKNIINMILVLIIWWCPWAEPMCCWKRVFVMTSVFSGKTSISLCLASFCTLRPTLPVTPDISWLLTFAF